MHRRRCRPPAGRPSAGRPAPCTRTLRRRRNFHLLRIVTCVICPKARFYSQKLARTKRCSQHGLGDIRAREPYAARHCLRGNGRRLTQQRKLGGRLDPPADQGQAGIQAWPQEGLADPS